MKRVFLSLAVVFTTLVGVVSCNKENVKEQELQVAESSVSKIDTEDVKEFVRDIYKEASLLKDKSQINLLVKSEFERKFGIKIEQNLFYLSKLEVNPLANEILEEFKKVVPSDFLTKDLYVLRLKNIINSYGDKLSFQEKSSLYLSAEIIAEIIELKFGNKELDNQEIYSFYSSNEKFPLSANWWKKTRAWVSEQWKDWGRCVSGIAGGAIGGGLAGAGVGSVVPGLGTGAGATIGAIGGGLVGAAENC